MYINIHIRKLSSKIIYNFAIIFMKIYENVFFVCYICRFFNENWKIMYIYKYFHIIIQKTLLINFVLFK